MTRDIKRFGIALVAIVAMSATAASAAYAAPEFTTASGVYPRNISGGQTTEHKFTAGTRTVTCKTGNFTGVIGKKSSNMGLKSEYKECHTNGGLPVTVTVTAEYVFYVEKFDSSEAKWTGDLHIVGDLTYDVYGSEAAHKEGKPPVCKYMVPEQTLSGITYTNSGGGILVSTNLKPAITIEGSPIVCGAGTVGSYTGSSLITASGDSLHVGGI